MGGGTDDDIWIGGNGNVGEAVEVGEAAEAVEAAAVSEEAIKDAATAAATAAVFWEASSMLVGIKAPVEVGEAEMKKKRESTDEKNVKYKRQIWQKSWLNRGLVIMGSLVPRNHRFWEVGS